MLTIRRMRPDELEACADLYDRVVRATFTWFPDLGDQAAKFRREAQAEEVYVALDSERLLGLAAFHRPDNFLHSLYVDYDAHGQGVGSALMAHIEAIADGPISFKVQTRNGPARRFYERKGFRIVEEGRDSDLSQWVRMRR
jgi:GNAT superfamily N-acetyltransferase